MAGRGDLLGQKKRYGSINEKVKMMFFVLHERVNFREP